MTLTRSHRIGVVVASISLVAATLAVVHGAAAQGGPNGQGGQGGPRGQGGFGPGGQGGPGFGGPGFGGPGFGGPGGPGFPGMMPGMGPGTVLAANNTRLFVLRGNTVFAYDAATLKMVGHTDLPTPEGGPDGRGPDGRGPDGRGPGGRGGNRPPQRNEDPR